MPAPLSARPRPTGPRRRRRSERGGVIVELAMIAPILIMLIMGIVDFTTLFNQKIGLRGGVREAAWNGSRSILGAAAGTGCSLDFSGVATPDDSTQRIMCLAKRRSGLPASEIRVKVRFVDLDTPTGTGSWTNGSGLMVCAIREPSSVTHFFASAFTGKLQKVRLTTVILNASTDIPLPVGGAERTFSGNASDWSFCDPSQPAPS